MPRINSSWYTITIILQFPSAVHKDSTLIKIWELSLTCLGLYLKKSTEELTLCVQRKGIFGRKHDFSCYQKWNNKGDTRYRYLGYCRGANRRNRYTENPPNCMGGIREFNCACLIVSLLLALLLNTSRSFTLPCIIAWSLQYKTSYLTLRWYYEILIIIIIIIKPHKFTCRGAYRWDTGIFQLHPWDRQSAAHHPCTGILNNISKKNYLSTLINTDIFNSACKGMCVYRPVFLPMLLALFLYLMEK
jgi:hypothetical protein